MVVGHARRRLVEVGNLRVVEEGDGVGYDGSGGGCGEGSPDDHAGRGVVGIIPEVARPVVEGRRWCSVDGNGRGQRAVAAVGGDAGGDDRIDQRARDLEVVDVSARSEIPLSVLARDDPGPIARWLGVGHVVGPDVAIDRQVLDLDPRADLGVEDRVRAVGADVPAGGGILGRAVDQDSRGDQTVEDPMEDVQPGDILCHVDVGSLHAALARPAAQDGEPVQVQADGQVGRGGPLALVQTVDREGVQVAPDHDGAGASV